MNEYISVRNNFFISHLSICACDLLTTSVSVPNIITYRRARSLVAVRKITRKSRCKVEETVAPRGCTAQVRKVCFQLYSVLVVMLHSCEKMVV